MDNTLIDSQLIELLRMPVELRTPASIAKAISCISSAAQIEIEPMSHLQRELTKLEAIVQFLAVELGMNQYDISLTLHEHQDPSSCSLCAYMKDDSTGTRLIGFGSSAQEALRNLHPIKVDKEAA
jgi:hypothetical protein